MTKSTMPPAAEIETVTVSGYRAQQAEALANDVFYQAEQVLRMLGDSGGGRALARLINALHGQGAVLNFIDLLPLDGANRTLALALIREFLNGTRCSDEWESLADLCTVMSWGYGVLAGESGLQLPIQVLRSPAGFYIGTFHPDEGPVSRESVEYWPTQEEAKESMRTGNWTQRQNP